MLRAAIFASAVAARAVATTYDAVSFLPIGKSREDVLASWDVFGDAEVHGDMVRVTPDQQHKRGVFVGRHAAHELADEWSVDATLRLHGNGVSLAGDGLALWYTQRPQRLGSLLGGEPTFVGLGIFVDTYINSPDTKHQHPYLSAVINDGTEIAAHDMAGFHTSLHAPAGCYFDVRQIGQHVHKFSTVRLSYAHRTLTIWTTIARSSDGHMFKPQNEWTHCATVSEIDLPRGYYFGASAATGEVTDTHDVAQVIVRNGPVQWPLHLDPMQQQQQQQQQHHQPLQHAEQPASPQPEHHEGQPPQAQHHEAPPEHQGPIVSVERE